MIVLLLYCTYFYTICVITTNNNCFLGNHSNLPDASLLKSIFMNDAKEPMTEVSNRNYERAVEVLVELGM